MKPIIRTMWLADDWFGRRMLFQAKPRDYCKHDKEWKGVFPIYTMELTSVKPPKHPEKSLKKVTVTIEEATC